MRPIIKYILAVVNSFSEKKKISVLLGEKRNRVSITILILTVTVDFDALTKRDKLQLAADLIHNVLQET
jgi:hypothetical protein